MIDLYLICLNFIAFLGATVACVVRFKKKNFDEKNSVLILSFIGGAIFHMMWETKSIYVIPFYVLLLPYSAEGLEMIFAKIDEKINQVVKGV